MQRKPMSVVIAIGAVILLCILFYAATEHSLTTRKQPTSENHRTAVAAEQSKQIAGTQPTTRQSWTGIASSHMAGPFLRDAGVYVDLPGLVRWPDAAEGRRVVVTGRAVVYHDLPVFIVPKNGPAPEIQGIPMPEGTDLYKASERTVIEDAQWHLAPGQPETKPN